MIKSNKDLLESVSNILNIEQDECKRALDFFWKKAVEIVEDYSDIEIYIYGLGTFEARRQKIQKLIHYYQVKRDRVSVKTNLKETTKEIILNECDYKLTKLEALEEKYQNQYESRKQFKQVQSAEADGNLQESISNMAGPSE